MNTPEWMKDVSIGMEQREAPEVAIAIWSATAEVCERLDAILARLPDPAVQINADAAAAENRVARAKSALGNLLGHEHFADPDCEAKGDPPAAFTIPEIRQVLTEHKAYVDESMLRHTKGPDELLGEIEDVVEFRLRKLRDPNATELLTPTKENPCGENPVDWGVSEFPHGPPPPTFPPRHPTDQIARCKDASVVYDVLRELLADVRGTGPPVPYARIREALSLFTLEDL